MSDNTKNKCPTCHGTGKITCRTCKGKGRRKCPSCHGTGHACPVCCNTGTLDERPGYKRDKYGDWDYCPNCHGDYTNAKFTCRHCDGTGIASCSKTEWCPVCDGKGTIDKLSKKSLRVFRALSVAVGFSGVQYLYVGQRLLFLLQFVPFVVFLIGVGMFHFEPLMTLGAQFGIERAWVRLTVHVMGGYLLLNLFLGMCNIERDAKGGKLKNEYSSQCFWMFFLFFGVTGAHLAYMKERLLLLFHWLYVAFPTAIMFQNVKMGKIGIVEVVTGIAIAMVSATFWEFVFAKIVNALFNTHFLDKNK